ncbi:MAG: hypothetical protein GY829_00860 [Gammaproteobacteria bacterium]|nr:hypothetical protein [Gammaproteobacteria bacterium]
MKKILVLSILFALTLSSYGCDNESDVVIETLLETYQGSQLENQKSFGNLYQKNLQLVSKESASAEELSEYLMITFVANTKENAAIQEAIAQDFIVVYKLHKAAVISILKKNKYLIPSTVLSFQLHLDFFGKSEDASINIAEEVKLLKSLI